MKVLINAHDQREGTSALIKCGACYVQSYVSIAIPLAVYRRVSARRKT